MLRKQAVKKPSKSTTKASQSLISSQTKRSIAVRSKPPRSPTTRSSRGLKTIIRTTPHHSSQQQSTCGAAVAAAAAAPAAIASIAFDSNDPIANVKLSLKHSLNHTTTSTTSKRRFASEPKPTLIDLERNAQLSSDDEHPSEADGQNIDVMRSNISPQSYYQISRSKTSIARHYADINANMPTAYWDYQSYRPNYGGLDGYDTMEKLGQGKFSEVFAGSDTNTGTPVVIKVLKPVKKDKIRREVLILKHVAGCPYTSNLYDVVRDRQSRCVGLIFNYQDNVPYKDLYESMTLTDIKRYAYQLLQAVDFTHKRGIMHRDIKPGNILIDPVKKIAKLSDWGLAEFYHPHAEYHIRVGTKGFKGPELLLNMPEYDYSVDMWAFGTTLASMIFKGRLISPSKDDVTGVKNMASYTGSEPLYEYIEKYRLTQIRRDSFEAIGNVPPAKLVDFVTKDNVATATDDGLDLVSKMLVVDHWERITAEAALSHPFFDSIRGDPICSRYEQQFYANTNKSRLGDFGEYM